MDYCIQQGGEGGARAVQGNAAAAVPPATSAQLVVCPGACVASEDSHNVRQCI